MVMRVRSGERRGAEGIVDAFIRRRFTALGGTPSLKTF